MTIKLISVETGETIKTGSEKYTTLNRLIDDCERPAQEFAGKITAAYVYQFSNSFSLGGWAGIASYFEPDYEGEPLYLPVFGAKFIFGNKIDGLAYSLSGIHSILASDSASPQPVIVSTIRRAGSLSRNAALGRDDGRRCAQQQDPDSQDDVNEQ
jgi:hypothetical protein